MPASLLFVVFHDERGANVLDLSKAVGSGDRTLCQPVIKSTQNRGIGLGVTDAIMTLGPERN